MSKFKNKIDVFSWLVIFLWMFLIFYLSAQPVDQSNDLSIKITEIIIEKVEVVAPNINFNINKINHLVRKNAHFFAYLVLGMLVMNVFRRSKVGFLKSILLSLVICISYAIVDEFHQLFVPGRGGQVKDVLIDSAGAVISIGAYVAIIKSKVNIRKRR